MWQTGHGTKKREVNLGGRMTEDVLLSPIPSEDHTRIDAATEFELMGSQSLRTPDELLDSSLYHRDLGNDTSEQDK
jgi:hypothetical protein